MTMKNNNMDKFLRESLGSLEVKPSQNVWKSISKRLLILELIRLNFTNVGKFWLYSGLATLTTIVGLSYYVNTNSQTSDIVHRVNETDLTTDSKLLPDHDIAEKTSTVLLEAEETNNDSQIENRTQTNKEQQNLVVGEEVSNVNTLKENKTLNQTVESSTINGEILPKGNALINQNGARSTKTVTPTSLAEKQDSYSTTQDVEIENSNLQENRNIELAKLPSRSSAKSSGSLYLYFQGGPISSPPLLINSQLKPTKFKQLKSNKGKKKKTQNAGSFKTSSNNDKVIVEQYQTNKFRWSASINYLHDWPLQNKDILPQSNVLSIKAGLSWNRWDFNLGIGLQGDNTTAEYEFIYNSYDSVGFFYDIDYYETIPGNPDSIIIHYTLNPVFDTVTHNSVEQNSENSRWITVPIEIGYQILQKESYVLKAGISARIGWEYYRESNVASILPSYIGASYQKIGLQSVSPFISLSLGLENQIKIYDKWWFIIEPQIYYQVKSSYKWDGSKDNGPIGFGINTGIKFKF